MATDPIAFVLGLAPGDLPAEVVLQAKRCLLDLAGIGIAGAATRASGIVRDYVADEMPGAQPMLFDGRGASAAGLALAGGMSIDSLDGHDGYNPAKGHVGCGLLPALVAFHNRAPTDGPGFLTALVAGYELGSRLALALHGSVPDYHTSGAWVAVAASLVGARVRGLSPDHAAHAAGIAEYHGPRSQMMRCIDHPTMLKDGSGWGALAGVSAVSLAARGFTGAPALTLSSPGTFGDLRQNWLILQQYFKPWPVCRWAQPPVAAALDLCRAHDIAAGDIAGITVETFHEATRLAVAAPRNTEEAQYSTSFPVAVALARGGIAAADIMGTALDDLEILRLAAATRFVESDAANAVFPARRTARVSLALANGQNLTSDWTLSPWEAEAPPSDAELRAKFDALVVPAMGQSHADAVAGAIERLDEDGPTPLLSLLAIPLC